MVLISNKFHFLTLLKHMLIKKKRGKKKIKKNRKIKIKEMPHFNNFKTDMHIRAATRIKDANHMQPASAQPDQRLCRSHIVHTLDTIDKKMTSY